jgi:ribonuclease P protein component
MKKNLTRKERIRTKFDFATIFKSHVKTEYNGIKALIRKNDLPFNRIAVILKKGIKSAVKRNREKRIIKEAYRILKERLITGYDIAFIVLVENPVYSERVYDLENIFQSFKLIS